MFLNYKLKVCSEVSLLLLLLCHPYEIRTHHHSSDSAVSSPSRPMDVKNNKRKLGKYICCKILELNQLPKVPKTFALPSELISRSNLSYYYLLLFLSGGGQARTAVFHTFNIKSLYSFLFF